MEITGKIIAVLELRTGVSRTSGNTWSSQEYVIETEEQYPTKMMFGIFGEDKIQQAAINVGDRVKVYFDINAREYNGRWFNEIRAWKVEHEGGTQGGQSSAPAPTAGSAPAARPAAAAAPPDPLGPGNNPNAADDIPFD